uniref:Uncharacterized protein n=1 Tax=Arundo donax TaxID=35708 RepID=A0A0A8ZN70_ARUDO
MLESILAHLKDHKSWWLREIVSCTELEQRDVRDCPACYHIVSLINFGRSAMQFLH